MNMRLINRIGIVLILLVLMIPFASAALWFSFEAPFVHFDTKDDVDYQIIKEEKLEPVYSYEWVDYQVAPNKTSTKTLSYQRVERTLVTYDIVELPVAIGVKVRNVEHYGNFNVKDNILYEWAVPIGDRNMEEFGECLPHEEEKGVCKAIPLYDVNKVEGVGELSMRL